MFHAPLSIASAKAFLNRELTIVQSLDKQLHHDAPDIKKTVTPL